MNNKLNNYKFRINNNNKIFNKFKMKLISNNK